MSRGDFLSYLDADDLWAPGKLEKQLAAFEAEPSLDMVSAHVRHFHSPELDPEAARKTHCPPHLMPGHFFAALIRRGLFERVGCFVTEWIFGETLDWYTRALDAGACVLTLEDPLVARRLHRTNHTAIHRGDRSDYARMVKAALDRRRATARAQDGGGNP